jgi:hypothetical protein
MSLTNLHFASRAVKEGPVPSTSHINQFLTKGTYRLIVVAPFGTKILVTPLNPVPGFQFLGDTDPTPEIWNSQIVTPQDGQFSFLVKLSEPLGSETLQVMFINESAQPPTPPSQPPAPPAQPPPSVPPPSPPAAPPGDMQAYYRSLGYRIAPGGEVVFFYVAVRVNRQTGQRDLCLCGLFAFGNPHLHDPVRVLAELPQSAGGYDYNRIGPFPTRLAAETVAMNMANNLFGDPTRYGMIGGGGGMPEIIGIREPSFR